MMQTSTIGKLGENNSDLKLRQKSEPLNEFLSVGPLVPGEWPVIGLLRFFLASVVICSHLWLVKVQVFPPILGWLADQGGVGAVFCFFIVSGYSIAASIEREPRQFYERRLIRIYPVYLTCLAFAVFCWLHFGIVTGVARNYDAPKSFSALAILLQVVGLPWLATPAIGVFAQCWSLTCELIYYALAPVFKRVFPVVLVIAAFASFFEFRIHNKWDWAWLYVWPTVCLFWVWISGWLYYKYRAHPFASGFLVFVVIVLAFPAQNMGEIWMYMITAFALMAARLTRVPKSIGKLFSVLGDISYPLYLCHVAAILTLYKIFGDRMLHFPGAYYAAGVSLAALIYYLVDRPAHKLLYNRFIYRKKSFRYAATPNSEKAASSEALIRPDVDQKDLFADAEVPVAAG